MEPIFLASTVFGSIILGIFPFSSSAAYATASASEIEDSITLAKLSPESRQEFLNKIPTDQEANQLLANFSRFISDPNTQGANSLLLEPTKSISIIYQWQPIDVVKERQAYLMVKFVDGPSGKTVPATKYAIKIAGTHILFNGSAPNGVDLRVIDAGTFPDGSSERKAEYNAEIVIKENNSTENASGLTVTVVPEFPKMGVMLMTFGSILATIVMTKCFGYYRASRLPKS